MIPVSNSGVFTISGVPCAIGGSHARDPHPFLDGFVSVSDWSDAFISTPHEDAFPLSRLILSATDWEAFKGDWQVLGEELQQAMEAYARGELGKETVTRSPADGSRVGPAQGSD